MFHFFHVICKISNFNIWTAKDLAQASCSELTLMIFCHWIFEKKYFQTFLRDCKYVIPKLNPDYKAKNRDTQFLFIFENTSKIFSCPKKLFSSQLLSIIEMKKRNRMGPSLLEILTFHLLLFAMMWVKIIVGNLLFGEYSCNKITRSLI